MIYPTGRYNLNFDICAMLLSAFIIAFFFAKKDLRARRVRMFLWVVFFMLVSSSCELITDIIRNGGIPFVQWQAETATALSHFFHNSVPYLMLLYFLSFTGVWHGMSRTMFRALAIPEIGLLVIHVIPPVRHFVYHYDAEGHYYHGNSFVVYMAIIGFYVACCFFILIRYRTSIREKDRIYIVILGVGFLGSMALGYIFPYLRATNFLQTLFMLGSFIVLENDDALVDPETGIYNTQALMRDANPLFRVSYASQVIAVKLQHFNYYRLMIGVSAMSSLLKQVGEWMKKESSGDITFYRISHGEFIAVMFNSTEDEAGKFAEKIRERFSSPWQYSGENSASIALPAQIWVTSIPDRMTSEEQLLVFAESNYNDALPKDRIYVADEMKAEQRRVDVDVAIRRALAGNTFDVYYQPIYDTRDGKIHSCEALVRMIDPELGYVSPEEFIKVAEQTGTVSQIGAIVFDKVCRFIAETKPSSFGLDFIEVNLSTIQCMDEHLVSELVEIMTRYGVTSSQIVLEITESAVIHNEDRMQQIVKLLQDAGFSFALDDFGTGHANYSYILNFPFRIIKIDKSFLWSADKSHANSIILYNMLQLVRDLDLQTVVEGVETEHHRDMLIEAGVAYLQGYYYSKPIPAEPFTDYVKQFNAKQSNA